MPSKSNKAASRQAKLRDKKRRDRPGPQQTDSGPTGTASFVDTAVAESDEVQQDVAVVEASPRPRPTPRPAARQRSAPRSGRRVAEAAEAPIYRYLGGELRQIGIISAIVVAILVALTFVLG